MSIPTKEFRAIFANPHNRGTSYGPIRKTIEEALKDRPDRSEETHEYLVAIETREVPDWQLVPLSHFLEKAPVAPSDSVPSRPQSRGVSDVQVGNGTMV